MGLGLMASAAEAAPFAYVTNSGSNTVSVIDTATNTVVTTVTVGSGSPQAVAVTPDGKHAYVTIPGSYSVSVIDTATNTVVATVTVGTNPFAVAVTPDGNHAYVANISSSNVSVIDTATNTVVATVTVGNGPTGVGIIPPSASALQVSPATDIAASGVQGQIFSPASFAYQLSSTSGSVHYLISGIPSWLNPSFTTGTVPPTVTDIFSVNACGFVPGTYTATIAFTNTGGGPGTTTRNATLTVNPGTKNGCKNGGWKKFTCFPGPFPDQGTCVTYFATR
jgi:YVTN family beta-propeller protein